MHAPPTVGWQVVVVAHAWQRRSNNAPIGAPIIQRRTGTFLLMAVPLFEHHYDEWAVQVKILLDNPCRLAVDTPSAAKPPDEHRPFGRSGKAERHDFLVKCSVGRLPDSSSEWQASARQGQERRLEVRSTGSRTRPAYWRQRQSSDFRKRKTLTLSTVAPITAIANICGQSTPMPTPFRNVPLRTTRR